MRTAPAPIAIGVAVAIAVGAGVYFGSAQLAGSASKPPPRTVTLPSGDVAVLGQVQCVATSASRRYPMKPGKYYLRCSKRPSNQARYLVYVFPDSATVALPGASVPLYQTPR